MLFKPVMAASISFLNGPCHVLQRTYLYSQSLVGIGGTIWDALAGTGPRIITSANKISPGKNETTDKELPETYSVIRLNAHGLITTVA
jgi:hypothetical protein